MIAAAAAAAPPTIEELADRGALMALAAPWERLRCRLAAQGGTRGPFLAPEWLAIFASSLCDERHRFRLLVAHRAGELCGALPLLAERRALSGVPARVLRSLSDDHSQRFDLLADGDETARALFGRLAADPSWDVLELRDVPDVGAPGVDAVSAAAGEAGFLTGRWASLASPYLPLATLHLDTKFRANLRRRLRKLEQEVGAVELERIDRMEGLDQALEDGFALEAAGWKGARGTAIACDPGLRTRYRALARTLAGRGRLALYFLHSGGRRVAFHFGVVEDGTYYLLKPGFDPALATYGLGHLLVDAVIRDLVARGVHELDFLGDDMPWKRAWTDRVRTHAFRYVIRPSAFGRALYAWKFGLAPRLRQARARLFKGEKA